MNFEVLVLLLVAVISSIALPHPSEKTAKLNTQRNVKENFDIDKSIKRHGKVVMCGDPQLPPDVQCEIPPYELDEGSIKRHGNVPICGDPRIPPNAQCETAL